MSTFKTILVVDDEPDVLEIFTRKLNKVYNIITTNGVDDALYILNKHHVDLIITDLVMPKRNGIELLDILIDEFPHMPIVVISGNATLSMAVKAMQRGAVDFIEKPIIDLNILFVVINRALETAENKNEIKRLKNLLEQDFDSSSVIGSSLQIKKAIEKIKRIANVDTTVLLSGETGVGKDLFMKLIVANSDRKHRRFVSLNCGSVPETLLESTLFGHKKGAFTSAYRDQKGYFEEANGGTIFLDEISETSNAFQTKLLHVIENRVIRKIGDNSDIPINVRIIIATNKDLKEEVQHGNFREDLFYRLNVIQIHLPPLRERLEDIQILSEFFLKEFAQKYKKEISKISPKTMKILLTTEWKGNVRELRNVIECAVVMATHDTLLPEDLPAYIYVSKNQPEVENLCMKYFELTFAEAKECFEKDYIINLLKITNGNVSKTAEKSKIDRKNLYTKFVKHGIELGHYKR